MLPQSIRHYYVPKPTHTCFGQNFHGKQGFQCMSPFETRVRNEQKCNHSEGLCRATANHLQIMAPTSNAVMHSFLWLRPGRTALGPLSQHWCCGHMHPCMPRTFYPCLRRPRYQIVALTQQYAHATPKTDKLQIGFHVQHIWIPNSTHRNNAANSQN